MSKVEFKYENGDLLKDRITGMEGIVMVRAEYATGCHHYGIQSTELKNGLPLAWEWLDTSRLECIERSAVEFATAVSTVSGAFPSGPQA